MMAIAPAAPAWIDCTSDQDTAAWHPDVRRFFDYWRRIAPPGRLPGRQHFDPMAIPDLLPRLLLIDVVRRPDGLRYRHRLVGTVSVETLERELTGQWFDVAHAAAPGLRLVLRRFDHMVAWGVATWRRGPDLMLPHKDYQAVENCLVPLASDGSMVDVIAAYTVILPRA